MSHFKAKMHQIQFRLWLCPRHCWGSLQHSPDHLAGFKGPTSKGREGKEGVEGGKGSHPLFSASMVKAIKMLIQLIYYRIYLKYNCPRLLRVLENSNTISLIQ